MAEEVTSDSSPPEKHEEKHNDRLKREHFLQQDSDHIDLDLLLQAVLDISDKLNEQDDRRREGSVVDDGNTSLASRSSLKSRDRHVTIDQASLPASQDRKNMSFSNFRVDDIDRENQRLLRQITSRRSPSAKTTRTVRQPPRNTLVSHSEINRVRFQNKVDTENEAFLRRLQAVKPTHTLAKEALTKTHGSQQKYSKNASKFRPTVRRSRPSSASSVKSRGSTCTSLAGDNASEASFASSRMSRASSASQRSSRTRNAHPVWEAGW